MDGLLFSKKKKKDFVIFIFCFIYEIFLRDNNIWIPNFLYFHK